MRLHVVYREDGSIVSLAEVLTGDTHLTLADTQALPGQAVVEAEVPGEFAGLPFRELHGRLHVDLGRGGPRLTGR